MKVRWQNGIASREVHDGGSSTILKESFFESNFAGSVISFAWMVQEFQGSLLRMNWLAATSAKNGDTRTLLCQIKNYVNYTSMNLRLFLLKGTTNVRCSMRADHPWLWPREGRDYIFKAVWSIVASLDAKIGDAHYV